MLIASALNLLTTRTSVNTVICLQTGDAELFLHHDRRDPDELRIELSPVLTVLRSESPTQSAATNRIERMSESGTLLERGLISEHEVSQLKNELLR